MAKFIELMKNGTEVLVNVENIITVKRDGNQTWVQFLGSKNEFPLLQSFDENYIVVKGKIIAAQ